MGQVTKTGSRAILFQSKCIDGQFRLRSVREVRYRLLQEARNLGLLLVPPRLAVRGGDTSAAVFPVPGEVAQRICGTEAAGEIRRVADAALGHRFPVFGSEIHTGPEIDWRRDYTGTKTSANVYFRRVPYLVAELAGDHKWIWELNRHQHLVVLAQAFLLFGGREYLNEIESEISAWIKDNPVQRGMNWASALEVAFRAMSWMWVMHLVGEFLTPSFQEEVRQNLYWHGLHIEINLSEYFSPNTHLLGEAVALHALGTYFSGFPHSARWRKIGGDAVLEQMKRQVREDGSHFEQSTYYHVYALDMFLFHAVLGDPPRGYRDSLRRMADYLAALMGEDGRLPFIGDDDGGRWFHPYGERDQFGRATLAACNDYFGERRWPASAHDQNVISRWWLGRQAPEEPEFRNDKAVPASMLFSDAGVAVLASQGNKIIVDAGAFGRGAAGHSHADTLSLTVTVGDEEVLIDPGTFTYVDKGGREEFRSTRAHNTIVIDGADQARAVNAFRWAATPSVRILNWETNAREDSLEAECGYSGFRHRRWIHFVKPGALLIVDTVDGLAGEHLIEQFWHVGGEARGRFRFAHTFEEIGGWRSRCYGQREPAIVLRVRKTAALPVCMAAAICLSDDVDVSVSWEGKGPAFVVSRGKEIRTIRYPGPLLLDN